MHAVSGELHSAAFGKEAEGYYSLSIGGKLKPQAPFLQSGKRRKRGIVCRGPGERNGEMGEGVPKVWMVEEDPLKTSMAEFGLAGEGTTCPVEERIQRRWGGTVASVRWQ